MANAKQNLPLSDDRWQLVNRRTGEVVVADLQLATTWLRRFLGLQFRSRIPANSGLLLAPCDSIHTFFCFFSMDVAFVSESGDVIRVCRNVRPWRVITPVKGAKYTVEANAGDLHLNENDQVSLIGNSDRDVSPSLRGLVECEFSNNESHDKHAELRESSSLTTRWLLFVLLLITAGMLAYGNGFSGVFVYDDMPNIVQATSVHSLGATLNADRESVPFGLRRRPIARLSFAINYSIHKLNPWGYHLVNLAIHVSTALLLFGIIRRVLSLDGTPSWLSNHAMLVAFSTTLIWLVHPLQTESVTYIVQRLEAMHGMFFLGALYALLRMGTQVDESSRGKRTLWGALSLLSLFAALATKEVATMYPLVALLFDRAYLARSWREVFQKRGWLHVIGFAMVAVYFATTFRRIPFYMEPAGVVGERTTSWEYLRTQPGVLLHYMKLAFWPKDLCLVYGWPVATSMGEIYGKGAIIVAMVTGSFLAYWRNPRIGFLGVAFFLILAPTSTVVPLHLAFEHRMYLPLASIVVGCTLAVGWGTYHLFSGPGIKRNIMVAVGIAGVLVAVPLAFRTNVRNEDYSSRVRLWQATLDVRPNNRQALANLANALEDEGRDAEAIDPYNRLVGEFPTFALGQHNAAVFLRKHRHLEEAEARARIATELRPDVSVYWLTLGEILEESGKEAEAQRALAEFERRSNHRVGRGRRVSE